MKSKLTNIFSNKIISFLFAFILMLWTLCNTQTLLIGLDANETWKVITTFFTSNPESSYVMYKGILTFAPGIVCYNIADFFNTNEFLILKIYNSIAFAYISSIGMPFLIESLFKTKIATYKRYLFIFVFFITLGYLFKFISVDFLSFMILLIAINAVVKMKRKDNTNIFNYLYIGFILGCLLILSGQYIPSAILIIFYIVITKIIPIFKKFEPRKVKRFAIALILFVVGFSFITGINTYFVDHRVEPARQRGEWIPSSEDWFHYRLIGSMTILNYPKSIPDNRGLSILKNEGLTENEALKNAFSTKFSDYIKLIVKYPIDFTIRWSERLFLGTINDNANTFIEPIFGDNINIKIKSGSADWISLYFMITCLFISLLAIKNSLKKVKNIFNMNTLIILSIIFAALVPVFMGHVENRYFMGIQLLIISVAIMSNTFWEPFIKFIKNIRKFTFKKICNQTINYNVIMYILFVIICFSLYGAIYESAGVNTAILFK